MEKLNKAVAVLKKGGVIICPTDTVYGFLADASNKKAVEKIYTIKKRPKSKPLSLFVAHVKMAHEIAVIDQKQAKMLRKFWPGKVTAILKRRPGIKIYGVKKDTVAIRIPRHTFLQKLLKKVNRPLVQTSVNISTQAPLNSLEAILAAFGKNRLVGLIIDGGSIKKAKPSKIVDLTSSKTVKLR
jgi:L-threonylcarbamoyladenylate synthase